MLVETVIEWMILAIHYVRTDQAGRLHNGKDTCRTSCSACLGIRYRVKIRGGTWDRTLR